MTTGATQHRRTPSPPRQTLVLSVPIAVLTAMSLAGTAVSPWLIRECPLLLIALCPRSVFLVGAASAISLPVFLVVGLARLTVADPFHFRLGRLHGQRAVIATASRWPWIGPVLTRGQHFIAGGGAAAAVAVSPTSKTLAVAGACGCAWRRVAAADVLGTTARLVGLYMTGSALGWPLRQFLPN